MRLRSVLLAAIAKLSSFSNLKKLILSSLCSTIVACNQTQATTASTISNTSSKIIPTVIATQIPSTSNQSEELTSKRTIPSTSVIPDLPTESKSIAQSSTSDIANSNGFILPSKNIYCLLRDYSARSSLQNIFLRCEIVSGLRPMPPKPSACEFDWGGGLVLPRSKKAQVLCASDSAYSPNYPILQYGQTWKKSGFTCKSSTDGLTCTNPEGQNFFLNREEWQIF
jgi:hypothetical protein